MSFRLGVVPQEWKIANISPVFKFDNKTPVENYRSVSLLSVPSKCQVKIIYHAIFSHVAPIKQEIEQPNDNSTLHS